MKGTEGSPIWNRKRIDKLKAFTTEQLRRWYDKWKKRTVHPSLRIDYFQKIDTKDKAYWLGFLYADGSLTANTGGTVYITIELNKKDEERIDRFCEALCLCEDKKTYRTRHGAENVMISFACKAMSNDLMMHGVSFRKSKIVRYPVLADRELELAFLMGYYDGDGQHKTTRIVSGSVKFLRDIKKRFDLPYKIRRYRHQREIYGIKTMGTKYVMSLGAELFCEMMVNYEYSMPRKRWAPCTKEEAARRTREALTSEKIRKRKERQTQWRAITSAELQNLIYETTITRIAIRFGVHYKTVLEKCNRLGISRPSRNYWQKKRAMENKAKS
jgi:hypothetical protein